MINLTPLVAHKALVDKVESDGPRSCTTCRYFVEQGPSLGFSGRERRPAHENHICARYADVNAITGEVTSQLRCIEARATSKICGPAAAGWEAKQERVDGEKLGRLLGQTVTVL